MHASRKPQETQNEYHSSGPNAGQQSFFSIRQTGDSVLKNHIGTLHAGSLFTVAQADAQAKLLHTLEQQNSKWKIAAYTSEIVYKRPAKGPVWVNTATPQIDLENALAHTVSTLNNEADESLAELYIQFKLSQGEQ